LKDGGTLSVAQVSPTVELDEIFRAFDPKTRRAFSTWLDSQGRGVEKGGRSLNDALATLTPFAEDVDDVLRILRRQDTATRGLVRDTGEVFGALSERRGQLRSLITNSNRVFETTAARDRQLQDTFIAFPTFLREARTTTRRLTQFAGDTDPLVTQLRPAARELSPALENVQAIAPDLRGLFTDLGPLIKVSRKGLPALEGVLDDSRPLLARFEPYLRTLQPTFDYLGRYKREITALIGNAAGTTQAADPGTNTGRLIKYLRTTNPISPEVLATYQRRLPSNRSNPYPEPGAYNQLARGLPTFGSYLCANPGPATSLAPPERNPLLTDNLRRLIEKYAYTPFGVTSPSCREQAPLGRLAGQSGRFPQLQPIPAP
jgi:phospholipid/cholesterol/gamma-HCH transport system substrate-binding protein